MHTIKHTPKDGPVMRWIANKAEPLIHDPQEQMRLPAYLERHRMCREAQGPYSGKTITFGIGHTNGLIDFAEVGIDGRYQVHIIFGGMSLIETYAVNRGHSEFILQLQTAHQLPQSVIATIEGTAIDQVIELPPTLQAIISGRKVLLASFHAPTTNFQLDTIHRP
jgi:hypothetical protein